MSERVPREITQRELRNESGAIMRSVEEGESFVITRNGTPIGLLSPLRRPVFVPREDVLAMFDDASGIDRARFRADLDAAYDHATPDRGR